MSFFLAFLSSIHALLAHCSLPAYELGEMVQQDPTPYIFRMRCPPCDALESLPDEIEALKKQDFIDEEWLHALNSSAEENIKSDFVSCLGEKEEDERMIFCSNQRSPTLREQSWPKQTLQEVSSQTDIFLQLPLDDNERKLIASIITTMAEKNILKLGLMRKTLEKKGRKIHHVHPLRFLGYIFSTPHLKISMQRIKKSHFKWDGFIDGLSKKMREEAHSDNLARYVPGFAQYLQINADQVMDYIAKHDWEGLVYFLL